MLAVITFVRTALKHWRAGLFGILLLALAVQTVRLGHRGNQLERAKINLNEARAELRAITTKKNEQAERTERNIDLSDKRIQIADRVAEKIEAAPLPGNCRTPDEVMREPRL